MRITTGYVQLTERMLQEARDTEEAIRRHEERCETDPEYYRQWVESVDWSHWDD